MACATGTARASIAAATDACRRGPDVWTPKLFGDFAAPTQEERAYEPRKDLRLEQPSSRKWTHAAQGYIENQNFKSDYISLKGARCLR
jgi:hypothetical protein